MKLKSIILLTSLLIPAHSAQGRCRVLDFRSKVMIWLQMDDISTQATPIYIDLNPIREEGREQVSLDLRVDVEERSFYGGYARIIQEHWTYGI